MNNYTCLYDFVKPKRPITAKVKDYARLFQPPLLNLYRNKKPNVKKAKPM